jgi:hypothetical protein
VTRLKRIILIFGLITEGTWGLHLIAQEKLQIGVSTQIHNTRLMVDLSSVHVKGAYRPTNVLFAEYSIGKQLAIHTGLGHTMMTQNSDAFKNNFHYLALPLYLKIGRLKENKRLAFKSFIGIDIHYLLMATHTTWNGNMTDIREYTQTFHFDLVGGAGIKFRLSDRFFMEGLVSISYGSNIAIDNAALMDINNLNTGYRLNLLYKF